MNLSLVSRNRLRALLVILLGSTALLSGSPAQADSWKNLLGGMDDQVYDLAVDTNGRLYAGGAFTQADVVTVYGIARWNGTSWSDLAYGMDDSVNTLVFGKNGTLYVGGQFTNAGGVAANRVAKWNGTTWSALGSGLNQEVLALAVDSHDTLYAGGRFTQAGGTSAYYIAKWNGSAWSPLTSGTNDVVRALTADTNGNVYAGGDFTAAGSVSASHVARWNGTDWSTLGNGTTGDVYALTMFNKRGSLYVGGNFEKAGGLVVNGIARWTGSSWAPLALGLSQARYVYALAFDGFGRLYAGGNFYIFTNNGPTCQDICMWSGNAWSALGDGNGAYAGMSGDVYALVAAGSGVNMYVGGFFSQADNIMLNRIAEWIPTPPPVPGLGSLGGVLMTVFMAASCLRQSSSAGSGSRATGALPNERARGSRVGYRMRGNPRCGQDPRSS
ncbi:MAG: hypothetical protein HYV63_13765 [Candidatus Schekmanbacteria bacterium]|nr:hypothetical protein [Candidatus Schekmanbacteria bacterium]